MPGLHYVNLNQTPEERKQKYWLARSCGVNSSWANRMRDWRLRKIERRFNLVPMSKDALESLYIRREELSFGVQLPLHQPD